MHSVLKLFFVAIIFSLSTFLPFEAKANIFFIEDQDARFTISFPDLWEKAGNQKPDDRLTMLGRGENDFAVCRVRVRSDRRFVIYPDKFNKEIQRTSFSRDFWNDYLGDYNDVNIEFFKDDSGLSFGAASMIEASYETAQGPIVRKKGIVFASLYHDQIYIVDCSSEESLYSKWRPEFLSIIKSIEFGKVTNSRKSGYYRNFMNDPEVEVIGPKALDNMKF